jgi:hypothetical protein
VAGAWTPEEARSPPGKCVFLFLPSRDVEPLLTRGQRTLRFAYRRERFTDAREQFSGFDALLDIEQCLSAAVQAEHQVVQLRVEEEQEVPRRVRIHRAAVTPRDPGARRVTRKRRTRTCRIDTTTRSGWSPTG